MKKLKHIHTSRANHDPTANTSTAPFKIFSRDTTAALHGQVNVPSGSGYGPTGGVGMTSGAAVSSITNLLVTA